MFGGGGESERLVGEGRVNVWWGGESECLVGKGGGNVWCA